MLLSASLVAALAGRGATERPRETSPHAASAGATPFARRTLIEFAALGLSEPSGIAHHPALDRLFVVGDQGALAELDAGGRRLRVARVSGDLEDVAVHLPSG